MQDQAPLSPARALFEELRENEDAGSFDTWPASGHTNDPIAADDPAATGSALAPAVGIFPAPDDIPELTPELATRRSAANSYGDLAAIIRLQSTEIERLALENDQLAVRLDAVHQRHEAEQTIRRDLEQKLRDAEARNEPPAPTFDVEDVRRAAREGMSAEVKPVLAAILDLLETTMSRVAETAEPAEAEAEAEADADADAPPQAPAPTSLFAEVMGDFRQLPAILTRPLDELTTGSVNARRAPEPVAIPSATPSATPFAPPSATPHATPYAPPYAPPSASPSAPPSAPPLATPFAIPSATPIAAPIAASSAPSSAHMAPPEPHAQRPRHEIHKADSSAMPGAFAWTSLFS